MTHFVVTVILPKGQQPKNDDQAEKFVDPLIAEYDENIQVPEYPKECYCVGRLQQQAARAEVDKTYGTIDDMKNAFAKDNPRPADLEGDAMFDWFDEQQKIWMTVLEPRLEAEREQLKGVELVPDPDCPSCHGRGAYPSRYNPKSRWDWWSVGGRWPGAINDHNYGYVRDVPEDAVASHIVTPDGVWHARGTNGWWATFESDMSDEDWAELTKKILSEHLDHVAVNIDCHI